MLQHRKFLSDLIECPSITPKDAGCLKLIQALLNTAAQTFHQEDTSNAYIEMGHSGPLFLFVGHTDVVPPGPINNWHHPPFSLTEENNILYGRGLVDMKGAIYAFCSAYLQQRDQLNGRVGILLTSDEEGSGKNGLAAIIPQLNIHAKWALVGEPTSTHQLGDTFKHQRRGSYHFHLQLQGQQGHIAYPQLSENPADHLEHFLTALTLFKKNLPSHHDLSIYSIETSSHTSNIIPGSISVQLNLRYQDPAIVNICLDFLKHYDPTIKTQAGALPYSSTPTTLKHSLVSAIHAAIGIDAQASSLGGTSDARFLAPIADEIIEFGLCSYYAHKTNEQVSISELLQLQQIYEKLLLNLMGKHTSTHKQEVLHDTQDL